MCKCVCVCGLNYLTKISGHKGHPNCKFTDPNTNSWPGPSHSCQKLI